MSLTNQGYAAKAWINFNGTGTIAIRASKNVSSIVDDGTGLYTINFDVDMPNVNYALSATAGQNDSASHIQASAPRGGLAVGSVQISVTNSQGTALADGAYISVIAFSEDK